MVGRVVIRCTRAALAGAFGAFLIAAAANAVAHELFPQYPHR